MPIPLAELNAMAERDVVAALGAVFEPAPWVAAAAATGRPFATVAALFAALRGAVEGAPDEDRRALLAAHREPAAPRSAIAPDAVAEPRGGLGRMSGPEAAQFAELSAAYREKFGRPFILCVERHGRASLLSSLAARLASDPETERRAAEAEVFRSAALRLSAIVDGAGALPTAGRVSTHVLDTVRGGPAAGVALELVEIVSAAETVLVAQMRTNADGRTDVPLIGGRPVPIAAYELRFALGDYHRRLGLGLPEPPFLDIVPLRFGVSEPEGHYHVPLVATPWSFQTYRGS
ncbi:2-oxo-4-hydroxy-4-carboxy-5-ureidoimidazoline decarboxylase [uncultured Methylobacterium sp.]|uniref:2-oxo-4-hydroxy-4-carboxy-5-ureidoimidazoline decarboxylase n=1 Tax=uncultured Methylobacterium sp. TaxID=157278 RepID=UPI0035CB97A9